MKAPSCSQLPVFHRRVPDGVVHSARSSRASGPGRCVWPKTTCSAPGASVSATRAIASRPERRSSSPVSVELKGPSPRPFRAATAPGIVTRPSRKRPTDGLPSLFARRQTVRDRLLPLASCFADLPCARPV